MKTQKLANIAIIFIGFVLLFLIVKEFSGFLRPFVIALILALLLVPITRISKEKKIYLVLNTISIVLILFIGFTILGTLFLGENEQNKNLNSDNNYSLDNLFNIQKISFNDKEYNISKFIEPKKITSTIAGFGNKIFSSATGFFSEFFLVLLFLMFILPSFDLMKDRIESKLNKDEKKKFRKSITQIEKSIRTYLSVKTLISAATALISGIIMYLFHVDFLISFTIMIFILNFIPSIGSFIAVLIIMFSFFILNGFTGNFIGLGILLTLVQIIFGSILEPKIAGRELELSPAIILLSLFFWGYIWGISGMFLAVPLTSIIKIILQNIEGTKKIVPFLS